MPTEDVNKQLKKDLKKIRNVVVYAATTREVFPIRKVDLQRRLKDNCKIQYYITDKIYVVKRDVIVIL